MTFIFSFVSSFTSIHKHIRRRGGGDRRLRQKLEYMFAVCIVCAHMQQSLFSMEFILRICLIVYTSTTYSHTSFIDVYSRLWMEVYPKKATTTNSVRASCYVCFVCASIFFSFLYSTSFSTSSFFARSLFVALHFYFWSLPFFCWFFFLIRSRKHMVTIHEKNTHTHTHT